ncbi:MAG: aspartate aminotransferase family protein [Lachnospiraceae bacterium]|nr:aspartate aminotransferase family protein [Candidatus Colinaster scatohippi]
MNKIIETAENNLLHTYNRFQIVLDHGEGVKLYDTDGKEYLDFFSGIGVYALGYNDKEYNDALKSQIDKLMHCSNLFYNEPAAKAAEMLTEISEMDKVFFTNSGAEAIEGALKAAIKYAYLKDGCHNHEIIALDHSFHGRTCGALAVTGKLAYREAFEPLIGKVNFANMNDLESVKALVNDKTCAIIMETVQGEGGIYPATVEFIEGVYNICQEKDILLILDEVQCGLGRTGYTYAWQQYNIKPDIMTTAKALGNGVPVGAFLMNKKVADSSLVAGDHGTTYGGNPFATAAVAKVLEIFKERDIAGHVKEMAPYLEKRLDELVEKYDFITERRGMGFMQGLELTIKPGDIVNKGIEKGILMLTAGTNVLRLLPPLVIGKDEIDKMFEILDSVFSEMKD